MTVGELIKELEKHPKDKPVVVYRMGGNEGYHNVKELNTISVGWYDEGVHFYTTHDDPRPHVKKVIEIG